MSIGEHIFYHLPDGRVVHGIVAYEHGRQDVQPISADVPVDAAELERARAGRRQVNIVYVSPNEADVHSNGREGKLAFSVPHMDHFDQVGDKAGFWVEGTSNA